MTAARRADAALRIWYDCAGITNAQELSWHSYASLIESVSSQIKRWPSLYSFEYQHPVALQDKNSGVGKSYTVRLNYSDVGGNGEPLIAIGGLTNVTQRFDFLAIDAFPEVRVIGFDLAGRGRSGWMVEMSDYNLDAYVEQLKQLLDHLQLDSCSLLGSSLGGSTALTFAARYPERVRRIVLNDSGPYIPVERRVRRAKAVGRHYVFQNPYEMFRRTGAAAKHIGPTPDAVLLHNSHHKTIWSENENGRVYRHDLRAMLAYRMEATRSLDLWDKWKAIQCPVLLIHGLESDATMNETVDCMRNHREFSVIQVHATGHTPSLSDGRLNNMIVHWMLADQCYEQDQFFRTDYNPIRLLYPDERREQQI